MTTLAANSREVTLKPFLTASVIAHVVLIGLMLASAYLPFLLGDRWSGVGGGGENVKVNLVGSAGLPMPKPPQVTESQVADPTKTLNKEEEKPKPPEPPTEAQKIPKFDKEKPLPPSKKSKIFEDKTPPPDNAVPGHGGVPNIPTGTTSNPGSAPGLAIQGQGGGDFGSRFPWYVDAMVRRLNQNWLKNTIDPQVRAARMAKTVVTYRIYRDGSVKNLNIKAGSGNASMDNSAMRAMMSTDTMPPLPNDYSGSYVDVEFTFDLGLNR